MSIGDSNVVDGADVNPPSADAGPDPCVSNHDVLPVVPVVPDVPVSTEAMMPCTARRGIMEIPDRPLCGLNHWSWIRSINVLPAIEGEHEAKYGISPVFIHQHTGHHAAHIHQHTGHHTSHVHVHHAENVTGVVNVYVTGVVTGVL